MANAKEKKEFIDNLRGRRVMVVGMARSGIAAGALLLEIGAKPVLYDAKRSLSWESLRINASWPWAEMQTQWQRAAICWCSAPAYRRGLTSYRRR